MPAEMPVQIPADASQEATPSPKVLRPHGVVAARRLAAAAAEVAADNNATDVLILDVTGQSAEFDYFVLATGSSRRQLHAISEQIDDRLQKDLGDRRRSIEGYQQSAWIVLDYGSVVAHLFDDESRQYYDLESLWADGTRMTCSELAALIATDGDAAVEGADTSS